MATGEIEIQAEELEILSRSTPLPFQLDEEGVDETLRIRYRWLDLRRAKMQRNIRTRAKLVSIIRSRDGGATGFVDIETPIMGKPTPEGARDFLVPTRLQPGRFFALPQSPQIYKQLLVISGFERYYQIARCFRDEDLRADRLQELTQLDVEMAFPDQEYLFGADRADRRADLEASAAASSSSRRSRGSPGRRPTCRYGSDKPDLRFGLEIEDATDVTRGFGFQGVRRRRGRAVPARSRRALARRPREARGGREAVGREGARLPRLRARTARCARRSRSSSARPSSSGSARRPATRSLFGADEPAMVSRVLGALRLHLGRELELIDGDAWRFLWVTDFPMFEWDPELERWDAVHHPFTRPNRRGRGAARHRSGRREGDRLRPGRERRSSSPAAPSGSTSPSFRRRSSGCSTSRPRSSARSSGSCSTRSRWARRRTAVSPRASTGSR